MNFTPSAFVLPPVNADAINTTTERFGIASTGALVSSTVPETPPAAHNGGTVYALGAEVSTGTAGGVISCWRSLQAGNVGHTPAEDAWWTTTGTTYSVWTSGTWAAGAVVLVVATHSTYERTAVSPGASAVSPEDDVAGLWVRLGTTNRWAMFDMLTSTPTYAVSPLTVVLTPGRISGMAALQVAAGEMDASMVSGVSTVYDHDESLDGTIIDSWDDWMFADFDPQVTVTLLDLPTYTDGVLTVTFTGGDDLSVGKLVVGTYVPCGRTEDAPRVRRKSFTVVERDDFGEVTGITKRKSIPMVSQTLMVEKAALRASVAVLDKARSTPCVVIGLDNDEDEYADLLTFLAICTDYDATPKSSGLCPINTEFEGV